MVKNFSTPPEIKSSKVPKKRSRDKEVIEKLENVSAEFDSAVKKFQINQPQLINAFTKFLVQLLMKIHVDKRNDAVLKILEQRL